VQTDEKQQQQHERKLREAGFAARVESVFEDALVPFWKHTLSKLSDPEFARKINFFSPASFEYQ